jgi:hypothetical protein
MTRFRRTTPESLLLAAAVLLAAVPRALAAGWGFYNMDEATTAIVARTILDGGAPYIDAADQRGPVTYSIYALIFRVAGAYNMAAVHVAQALLMAVLTLLVYRVAALQGRRSGLCAAGLFAVTSYASSPTDFLAFHVEWCLVLFSLIGVLCLWQGLAAERSRWLMLSGAAFALAALSKQPALADVAVLLVGAVVVSGGTGSRRVIETVGAFTVGFGGVAVAYLGSAWAAGALDDFWFNYWTYNTRYFLAPIPASERIIDAITLQSRHLGRHLPLLVLFAIGLFVRIRAWGRGGRPWMGKTLLPFVPYAWALSSYLGASWSGRDSGHYFIQLAPSACWVCGQTLADLLEGVWRHLCHARAWQRQAVVAALIAAVCAPIAAPNSAARSLAFRLLGGVSVDETLRGAEQVASWLRARPDQGSIFVWGFMPELYVLADRNPASRFILCNPLSGMIPWVADRAIVPAAWDTFRAELERRPPRYIIDTSPGGYRMYAQFPPEESPDLWEIIESRYHLEATICEQGTPVFRIFEQNAGGAGQQS